MKKISILTLCAAIGLGAMAQEAVVKEAERAMKKGETYEKVLTIITPAFTDPSTSGLADTYYIPGMAAFKQFDTMLGKEALGQLPEDQQPVKAGLLIIGYDQFQKALPLDTVVEVDKKGKEKVKTKYSKDIINTIGGHFNDYNVAAVTLYNAGDYKGAYQAWDIYTSLPSNPLYKKVLNNVPNDTIIGEICYNQALAAWQIDEYDAALSAFKRALKNNFNEKKVYDYAIAVASAANQPDQVVALAEQANALYGKEDANYIGLIINQYIKDQKYNDAIAMVDQAIANNPNNAQYYVIKGVLFEQDGVDGDPKAQYAQAYEIDPENGQAAFNLGRMYLAEALDIYNNAPNEGEEYYRVFKNEFTPVMNKAVELLERAYEIDNDNTDALQGLLQGYYLLNDDANLKRVEGLLGQ